MAFPAGRNVLAAAYGILPPNHNVFAESAWPRMKGGAFDDFPARISKPFGVCPGSDGP